MLDRARQAVNAWGARAAGRFGLRTLVWAALLAALALALDFVPLYDLLGYDFSFAMGLLAALAGVDIGHGVMVRARRAGPPAGGVPDGRPALARTFAKACRLAAGTLIAPLLLSLANAARVRNCSLAAGLGFFALLPLATILYAAPAGVLAGLVAPRRGRALAFAIPLASIVWTLLRLYRDPPVFAFDPFGGYFPGPIYDEALRPPLSLLLFRVANLVWIGTAIVVAIAARGSGLDPRRWCRGLRAAAIPLLAASVTFYALGGALGFHVQHADLERTLDRTLATQHFLVHYAAGTKSAAELALTGEDLEFRYQQLHETLGVEPVAPITLWDFPSAEVKKALVGAGHTLYAKPWTREMFMQGERFPSPRLRHEMAHVFAGRFGDPLLGVSLAWRLWGPLPHPVLAMGLVEGIAEAADAGNPEGDATIHQEAAAMIAANLAPPLAAVVGAGFSTLAGARAYTIAGSFSAFLLATRGAEKLRALYRSAGNFTDVYRTPLRDLEREWRQFLATQPVTPRQRAQASEAFRRPAIFKRVCARELGARIVEARAVLRGDPNRAVALLQSTCHDDPGEPLYRLALAQAQAAAGDLASARGLLARLELDGDLTVPLRAAAENLAAEIDFAARDFGNAEVHQRRAIDLATTEAERRLAFAKLEGLAGPGARATLGRVLLGDDLTATEADPVLTFYLLLEYARLFPTERLGPYLIGRQLLGRDPARALPYLQRACGDEEVAEPSQPQALPSELARECRRMIAEAAYRVGDFARAREALARLATDATEADRLRALDMRARVDWAASRRSGAVGASAP
jgi:Tetratricopeptide repeat